MLSKLVFIDTETTGLDPLLYQAYEVAWASGDELPDRLVLPHDWRKGDPFALTVGHYFDREIYQEQQAREGEILDLYGVLVGATLVGSNPTFDANHLTQVFARFDLGPPWHHRLLNVAEGAMWIFGWDRPKGLADVTKELRDRGHQIPKPDHTAVGDVLTTRAVYYALRAERAKLRA